MKLSEPINKNYCATVVKLRNILPLENCDNVVATTIFGLQAIVSKSAQVGDIGIVFPAETQLSHKFCQANNLYRHAGLNNATETKGYLEDNRRVKAVKFRGHQSTCLFMSLDSLQFIGADISELKEGDEFDFLNGEEICQKYVVKTSEPRVNGQTLPKQFKRVDTRFIPEHFDSDNYFKFSDSVDPEAEIIVTQKLHGTSIRIGNTIVKRKLNIIERFLKMIGVKIQETEFDYVFGSRKVIKDVNNPYQNHFYDVDIWTSEGKKLEGLLPENFIVYAELVGWTPGGAPIQKDYTYSVPQGECKLYVYRIAVVNGQGRMIDLSWDNVKQFCDEIGLLHVPELYRGKKQDFDVTAFLDINFLEHGLRSVVAVGDALVDEGVCVRVDKLTPYILKAKSPKFLEHETKILDTGEVDLETEGSSSPI